MKTRVMVTSSARDAQAYPTPSEYEASLPTVFKGVNSVALLAATFPNVDTVISSRRDTIYVSVDGALSRAVSLPYGDPSDASALASSLQTALSATFPSSSFTVAAAANNALTISSGAPFAILVRGDRGLYMTLGLGDADLFSFVDTTTVSYVLTSPSPVSIRRDAIVILNIDGMEVVASNDGASNRSFAVLPTSHLHKSLPTCYKPQARIAKLSKMKIAFTRSDGTPYDFRGYDNFLQFELDHGNALGSIEPEYEEV